jgi:hypothetical protein
MALGYWKASLDELRWIPKMLILHVIKIGLNNNWATCNDAVFRLFGGWGGGGGGEGDTCTQTEK